LKRDDDSHRDDEFMHIKDKIPKFLELHRETPKDSKNEILRFKIPGKIDFCKFSATTVFPDPKEDFLLVIAGSNLCLRNDSDSSIYRISVAKLMRRVMAVIARRKN